MLFTKGHRDRQLAPQLFKKHKIWGRSAASHLITFFFFLTAMECCPLKVLRGYLMQIAHLAGEQSAVQEGQRVPTIGCVLVARTSPEHWPPDSEARATLVLWQQMRK